MSVSAISSSDPSALQSLFSPRKAFQTLAGDLNSGNLAGAQKDFASLQQDILSIFQAPGSSSALTSSGTTGSDGATADLQQLQSDLNANDLAGAQKDFAAFKHEIQSLGGIYRHPQQSGNAGQAAGTSSPAGTMPNLTIAAILSAYKAFSDPGATTNSVSAVA